MKKIFIAITLAFIFLMSLTGRAEEQLPNSITEVTDEIIVIGPGIVIDTNLKKAEDDLGTDYLSIPLTDDDIRLMARMAYGETMYHDGTCPVNTVKACYEVVFNRYLYDMNNANSGSLFHKGELTISRILTKGQFEGIVSESTFSRLSEEKQNEYINLVWQVHNQGCTILTTDYLYWQSYKGSRGKDNRIWVGFIRDDNGNIIEGTTTDKAYIVKGRGNWYRKGYK